MIENLNVRIGIVLASILIAVIWLLPNFVEVGDDWFLTKDKIVYGLDIQGGLHLVMGVDVDGVITEKIARQARSLRKELENNSIAFQSVQVNPQNTKQIEVKLANPTDYQALEKYINDFYPATLQILDQQGANVTLRFYDARIQEYHKQVIDQAIEVIRNRIDEFGVAEPSIAAQGEDRILVQLPGISDSARAKELINRTARLEFRIVDSTIPPEELSELVAKAEEEGGFSLGQEGLSYLEYVNKLNEALKDKLPEDTVIAFQKPQEAATLEAGKIPYLLRTDSDLSGDLLEDAAVVPGEFGAPEVNFKFDPEGRRRFSDLTEENTGKQMAIVLDEIVQSAPVIQGKINSDSARITLGRGNYQETLNEANFIATALRAGALPAALEQLEERTVGPTLGADSINKGKRAGLVGALLVIIFMLVYYRRLGLIANTALALNIIFILAILTSLGATLTLPGVAGIVLTVGMAVDANVIIFERIKEELRKGAGLQSAIKDGFGHAFSAIVDANITTAAVCIVLMYFGTGPVRGFAVTLMCGIVTSMFTAIFVSRTIIDLLISRWKMQKLISV